MITTNRSFNDIACLIFFILRSSVSGVYSLSFAQEVFALSLIMSVSVVVPEWSRIPVEAGSVAARVVGEVGEFTFKLGQNPADARQSVCPSNTHSDLAADPKLQSEAAENAEIGSGF
jgi:hypothetical protein